jgi:hypothetical protein
MSISSKRLQELTEEKIGDGQSRYLFGRGWKELYEVMSKEEGDLTEELFEKGLRRCKFKDPERVGLISLVCPLIHIDIPDRMYGKYIRELYRFCLYIWYFMLIISIIQSLINWELDSMVIPLLLCLVVTSWSFRMWSKEYNKLELIFHVLDTTGKIDRVLGKERRE